MWEQAAAALARQARKQQGEADELQTVVGLAEERAQQVWAEVAGPLIEPAAEDGTAYLTAPSRMWEASRAHGAARGLRKRGAARAVNAASSEGESAVTRSRWGSAPQTPAGVETWAETAAYREADADPRVTDARERVDEAKQEQQQLTARQMRERSALVRELFGDRAPGNPQAQAARWRQRAETARRDLETIETLPVTEAAHLIRNRAEQERAPSEAVERDLAAREARAAKPHDFIRRPPDRGSTSPTRGLGL